MEFDEMWHFIGNKKTSFGLSKPLTVAHGGATGIAVFDDEHNGNYRHYFDISDTHGSRFERPVPLWQMQPKYEAEVIESLENSFGDLDDESTLADPFISAAKNAVEENIPDYLRNLMYSRPATGETYGFFYNQPEAVIRPYPYAIYVTDVVNIIRP